MLAVTKFKSHYDVDYGNLCLIRLKRRHTASICDLNLVTASISPSIQDVQELHALSPPSAGRYALGDDKKKRVFSIHGSLALNRVHYCM